MPKDGLHWHKQLVNLAFWQLKIKSMCSVDSKFDHEQMFVVSLQQMWVMSDTKLITKMLNV